MAAVPASCREMPQKATAKAATAMVLPTPFHVVLPTVTVETNSEVFARKIFLLFVVFKTGSL